MIIDTNILVSLTGLDFIDLTAKENEIIIKFSKLKLHQKIVPTFILTEYSTLVEKVIPKKYSLDKESSEAVHNISRGIM